MNNELNNINGNIDKNTINELNTIKYKCIFHCPLSNNDIASTIDLDNNYLVYGTLMGEVALCLIDDFSFKNDSNVTLLIDDEKKRRKK